MEINYRALFFICLIVAALTVAIYPALTEQTKPIPEGYIELRNGSIIPIPTSETITKTVYITPTPDNGKYYVADEQSGIRKMGRYFVFNRKNVSGYQDISFHVTFYGFKIIDSFHYWEYQTGNYERIDAAQNKKFLFAFIQIYTDDLIGDDVRNFVPSPSHFQVYYKGQILNPMPFQKDMMIYELENTYNLNNDYRIQYYAQFVKVPLMGKDAGKRISEEQNFIYGGKSNAIDGYIVYSIPSEATADDLIIHAELFGYGYSEWVFKT